MARLHEVTRNDVIRTLQFLGWEITERNIRQMTFEIRIGNRHIVAPTAIQCRAQYFSRLRNA